jgi:hypothetical protein
MAEASAVPVGVLVPLIVIALFVLIVRWTVLFYPRHRYHIEGEFLVIRRRLLSNLPRGTIRVPLGEIERVEERGAWPPALALDYSNGPALRRVLVTLKRPRYLLFRKLLLTPEDPTAFVDALIDRLGTSATGGERDADEARTGSRPPSRKQGA